MRSESVILNCRNRFDTSRGHKPRLRRERSQQEQANGQNAVNVTPVGPSITAVALCGKTLGEYHPRELPSPCNDADKRESAQGVGQRKYPDHFSMIAARPPYHKQMPKLK